MKEYIAETLFIIFLGSAISAMLYYNHVERIKRDSFEVSCSKSCGIINHRNIDDSCYCQTSTGWEKSK